MSCRGTLAWCQEETGIVVLIQSAWLTALPVNPFPLLCGLSFLHSSEYLLNPYIGHCVRAVDVTVDRVEVVQLISFEPSREKK